jgi:ankyrin repeat protein
MIFRTSRTRYRKVGMMPLLMAVFALWATVAIAGINEDLVEAARRGDLPEVKSLLAKGADVNAKIKVGGRLNIPKEATTTALKAASFGGHREVVEELLDNGADVNAKDYKGYTALMAACAFNRPEVVQLLLDKGADVNAMASGNRTAFSEANGIREIQEMLIEAGAMDMWSLWWRLKHYFSLLTNYPERK